MFFRPGSAGSLAKSLNGSIRSDLSSENDMDGDNINVVVRVRPLNPKEEKLNEDTITQFPGAGQLWVSAVPLIGITSRLNMEVFLGG